MPAWRSASAGVSGADRYSSFGYANVLRHVLGNILGTRREVVPIREVVGSTLPEASHVEVRSIVVEPVEAYLYQPAHRAFLRLSSLAKRLQSGHLDAYVSYMLIALIVVLAVVAAMR